MTQQNSIVLFAIILLYGISKSLAANWAVLVAGSSGWYNYRHQADVCHAYQVLHQNGIPDSNIIVMMYDDLAHNREYARDDFFLMYCIVYFILQQSNERYYY